MVKVVKFHETGGPEVLKFEDTEVGEPGEGELRVKVEAIGLNRAEAMFRQGAYLEAPDLPAGIGYECSAVVEAVGSGVHGFSEGDPVSVIPAFSMNDYSVYAESAIVPAYAATPRPEGLDAIHAAALWMPFMTAYGALIDIGGLGKGDAVVIPAASSSVGLAAMQIANSVGAVSIAATRTDKKVDALSKAGAQHVVVTEQQDLAEEVSRITDNRGANIIFDPVAGPDVETRVDAIAPGGTLFIYGALSGEPTPFPLVKALNNALTMRGYALFEIVGDPERFKRGKEFIRNGQQAGDLQPTVSKTFAFDDIADAHRYMESNQQFGKIVVTV